jgi:hypothetical protein
MNEKPPNRQIVRISRLQDQGAELDLVDASVEERWIATWEMTKAAWAMKGEPISETDRLRRDIESFRKLNDS